MTRDQVVSTVTARADATNVTLMVEGKATTASLNEAGISLDAEATADEAMKGSTSLFLLRRCTLYQPHRRTRHHRL